MEKGSNKEYGDPHIASTTFQVPERKPSADFKRRCFLEIKIYVMSDWFVICHILDLFPKL